MHIFYNGLRPELKVSIDAAAGGSFMSRNEEQAGKILDDMDANNFHWTDDRSMPKGGVHSTESVDKLSTKVDLLSKQIAAYMVSQGNGSASQGSACELDVGPEYVPEDVSPSMDQANALFYNPTGNPPFPQRSSNNPGYSPNNRNSPNFGYRPNYQPPNYQNQNQTPNYQTPLALPSYQAPAPFQPTLLLPPPKQNIPLETLMETYMKNQEKKNEYFTNSITSLSNATQQLILGQKAIESQISQLATQVSGLQKPQIQLPPQPEQNPRSSATANAIILRSGREIQERQEKEKNVEKGKNVEKDPTGVIPPLSGRLNVEASTSKDKPLEIVTDDDDSSKEKSKEKSKEIPPYEPPIPFLQRLARAKVDERYGKFLEMVNKIES